MFFRVYHSWASSAACSRVSPLLSRSLRSTSFLLDRSLPTGLLSSISALIILFTYLSSLILSTCPNRFLLAFFSFKETGGWCSLSLISMFLKKIIQSDANNAPQHTHLKRIKPSLLCHCQRPWCCTIQQHWQQYSVWRPIFFDLRGPYQAPCRMEAL